MSFKKFFPCLISRTPATCFFLLPQEESLEAEMNWCHNRRGNYIKKSEIVIGWIMNRLVCKGSLQDGRGKAICKQESGREINSRQWQSPPASSVSVIIIAEQSRYHQRKVSADRGSSFYFLSSLLLMATFDIY